ncbi:DUF4118 domain-containing protein [Streptomyces sp. NPDC085540]|uniref:DUF4118 domain-containing protein n=1 Tax=Streptomyces sp. NPDC085540 TaxID=3365730 RepID=UPI0037D1A6FE
MSGYRLHQLVALIAALAAPFLTALALVPFRTDLSAANAALVLVVAVVAVAAVGTRAAGVLAALSAAVGFDLLLARPYGRFAITDGEDVRTAALLLIVGLIVSQLAVRVQRLEGAVITDGSHLSRLEVTGRLAEDGAPPEAVVEHVRRDLVDLLGLRDCPLRVRAAHRAHAAAGARRRSVARPGAGRRRSHVLARAVAGR